MVLTKCIESTSGINSTFRHVIVTQLIMSLAFLTNAELTLPEKIFQKLIQVEFDTSLVTINRVSGLEVPLINGLNVVFLHCFTKFMIC